MMDYAIVSATQYMGGDDVYLSTGTDKIHRVEMVLGVRSWKGVSARTKGTMIQVAIVIKTMVRIATTSTTT
jgi:hypothetical protein